MRSDLGARRLTGCGVLLLAVGLLCALPPAGAIHPMDHLPHGQDLVDEATAEIDGRVAALQRQGLDGRSLFLNVHELVFALRDFGQRRIAPRYPLESPDGLLITDGIADTLATRLGPVLGAYVAANPHEDLGQGRQAFELTVSTIPVPPGRFLGFHFEHMAYLYAVQADTILAVAPPEHHSGVHDGFLRRLWDLAQLYDQVHKTSAEKYFCRIAQEDWMLQRMVCPKCQTRGLKYRDQRMGLREDTTAACQKLLLEIDNSPEGIRRKFDCRAFGHVFDADCPQCDMVVHFNVPLPYYRELQLKMALGEELPDLTPLIRTKVPQK